MHVVCTQTDDGLLGSLSINEVNSVDSYVELYMSFSCTILQSLAQKLILSVPI